MSLLTSHNDSEYTIMPGSVQEAVRFVSKMVHYFGYFGYMFLHSIFIALLTIEEYRELHPL